MKWSLSHYNLICYGSTDLPVFLNQQGIGSFSKARLFEYTSPDVANIYRDNLASLSELPTLVVAEAQAGGKQHTPAFFSRIHEVRVTGGDIRFEFRHLYGQLSSEEVFGCGLFDIDVHGTGITENFRNHWAIKEGNLIEALFNLLDSQGQSGADGPPTHFDVAEWPLPELGHVAVMMSFDAAFRPVYETIKAACEDMGLEAVRIDEIYGPEEIKNDIFSTIVQSRVVISDFTGRNPNVMYETGLAHARDRKVISIVQNEADVPFDLRHIRFVKYAQNSVGLDKLKEDLKKSLRAILD